METDEVPVSAMMHASSVVMQDHAVLIRGDSGSGKSDLALRLLDRGARLLSDDQTRLQQSGFWVHAFPPPTIAGLMEVRGLGVVTIPGAVHSDDGYPVALVVDLVSSPDDLERLPDQMTCHLCAVEVPSVQVYGFAASAPMVVELALDVALGRCSVIR
jgi:serine kinase of HPr protein (carbohydrate metabolism regulator)